MIFFQFFSPPRSKMSRKVSKQALITGVAAVSLVAEATGLPTDDWSLQVVPGRTAYQRSACRTGNAGSL